MYRFVELQIKFLSLDFFVGLKFLNHLINTCILPQKAKSINYLMAAANGRVK
jgi:hypothetical protein